MIERELDVLARTVYGEARGEGRLGKIAVACTVINRAACGGWWGKTITEVCLAPKQFSCWNTGDPNRAKLMSVTLEDSVYRNCYEATMAAYMEIIPDPTDGACHYHALSVNPSWAQGQTDYVTIGNHKFYRGIA